MPSLLIDSLAVRGHLPGTLGRITELHGSYYAAHWALDLRFEVEVAAELADFLLRFDARHDGLWVARQDDRIVGSIVIDGGRDGGRAARLRWFIVAPDSQGGGLGGRLIETALAFTRQRGFESVYLWTFDGLAAARRLYDRAGFELLEQKTDDVWGAAVTHQRLELRLAR